MAIVSYVDQFTEVSLGKDFPAMGPWRNQKVQFGPGGGRGAAIIKGIILGGSFVYKHRKFFTRVGSVFTGHGVSQYGKTNGTFSKALSTTQSKYYRSRRYKRRNSCAGCKCCRQKQFKRSRRRKFY